MKACMVSKRFPPYAGGLEARVAELARWLVGRGDSVLVLTSMEEEAAPYEVLDGVVVRRSNVFFSVFNALFAFGILWDLFREDYDFIDVNLPDPVNSVFAFLASVVRGKPMYVTYHADIVRDGFFYLPFKLLYRPLEWLVMWRARRIFVTSKEYAESSPEVSGFLWKAVVAPNFVDTERYNPSVDGSSVKSELGLGGRKMVLFVGRLVEYKGVEYLIEAAATLRDDVFVVVGEGPLSGSLRSKAERMGLGNVVFAGRVSGGRLPEYYAACDVFVLPSVTRQEAFGIVLIEAMASGKPVVSTNISAMPFVVGDGGVVVPPRDPKALADAVNMILSDSCLASRLAENGFRRVRELFNRDVVCSRIREVYSSA